MLFDRPMTADEKFATTNYDAGVSPALTAFMREGWAPDPAPAIEPSEVAPYAAKRRSAASAVFPGEVIVVAAGTPSVRNNDVFHPFRANSDFVWLTGAAEPDAVLVMTPDAESPGGHASTLYLRVGASRHESEEFYRDRNYGELWTGRRPGLAETQASLGLTTRPLGELVGALHALSTAGAPVADDALVATTLSDLRLRRRERARIRGRRARTRQRPLDQRALDRGHVRSPRARRGQRRRIRKYRCRRRTRVHLALDAQRRSGA
jgi:Xaa-Pro aminopeptidase